MDSPFQAYPSLYTPSASDQQKFIAKTYGWMALALFISALAAFAGSRLPFITQLLFSGRGLPVILLTIAEIALVWILTLTIQKISPQTAVILYIAYALINGLTMSSIFFVFRITSIAQAFFASAFMFGGMCLYGFKTKRSLNGMGHYLTMALIGLIVINVINIAIVLITKQNIPWVDWLISLATVLIFTGLTAYDTQRILKASRKADSSEAYQKLAIFGALELYLDFINIFLSLLRLFGKTRD